MVEMVLETGLSRLISGTIVEEIATMMNVHMSTSC